MKPKLPDMIYKIQELKTKSDLLIKATQSKQASQNIADENIEKIKKIESLLYKYEEFVRQQNDLYNITEPKKIDGVKEQLTKIEGYFNDFDIEDIKKSKKIIEEIDLTKNDFLEPLEKEINDKKETELIDQIEKEFEQMSEEFDIYTKQEINKPIINYNVFNQVKDLKSIPGYDAIQQNSINEKQDISYLDVDPTIAMFQKLNFLAGDDRKKIYEVKNTQTENKGAQIIKNIEQFLEKNLGVSKKAEEIQINTYFPIDSVKIQDKNVLKSLNVEKYPFIQQGKIRDQMYYPKSTDEAYLSVTKLFFEKEEKNSETTNNPIKTIDLEKLQTNGNPITLKSVLDTLRINSRTNNIKFLGIEAKIIQKTTIPGKTIYKDFKMGKNEFDKFFSQDKFTPSEKQKVFGIYKSAFFEEANINIETFLNTKKATKNYSVGVSKFISSVTNDIKDTSEINEFKNRVYNFFGEIEKTSDVESYYKTENILFKNTDVKLNIEWPRTSIEEISRPYESSLNAKFEWLRMHNIFHFEQQTVKKQMTQFDIETESGKIVEIGFYTKDINNENGFKISIFNSNVDDLELKKIKAFKELGQYTKIHDLIKELKTKNTNQQNQIIKKVYTDGHITYLQDLNSDHFFNNILGDLQTNHSIDLNKSEQFIGYNTEFFDIPLLQGSIKDNVFKDIFLNKDKNQDIYGNGLIRHELAQKGIFLESYKQENVQQALGIDISSAHIGQHDAETTYKIADKLNLVTKGQPNVFENLINYFRKKFTRVVYDGTRNFTGNKINTIVTDKDNSIYVKEKEINDGFEFINPTLESFPPQHNVNSVIMFDGEDFREFNITKNKINVYKKDSNFDFKIETNYSPKNTSDKISYEQTQNSIVAYFAEERRKSGSGDNVLISEQQRKLLRKMKLNANKPKTYTQNMFNVSLIKELQITKDVNFVYKDIKGESDDTDIITKNFPLRSTINAFYTDFEKEFEKNFETQLKSATKTKDFSDMKTSLIFDKTFDDVFESVLENTKELELIWTNRTKKEYAEYIKDLKAYFKSYYNLVQGAKDDHKLEPTDIMLKYKQHFESIESEINEFYKAFKNELEVQLSSAKEKNPKEDIGKEKISSIFDAAFTKTSEEKKDFEKNINSYGIKIENLKKVFEIYYKGGFESDRKLADSPADYVIDDKELKFIENDKKVFDASERMKENRFGEDIERTKSVTKNVEIDYKDLVDKYIKVVYLNDDNNDIENEYLKTLEMFKNNFQNEQKTGFEKELFNLIEGTESKLKLFLEKLYENEHINDYNNLKVIQKQAIKQQIGILENQKKFKTISSSDDFANLFYYSLNKQIKLNKKPEQSIYKIDFANIDINGLDKQSQLLGFINYVLTTTDKLQYKAGTSEKYIGNSTKILNKIKTEKIKSIDDYNKLTNILLNIIQSEGEYSDVDFTAKDFNNLPSFFILDNFFNITSNKTITKESIGKIDALQKIYNFFETAKGNKNAKRIKDNIEELQNAKGNKNAKRIKNNIKELPKLFGQLSGNNNSISISGAKLITNLKNEATNKTFGFEEAFKETLKNTFKKTPENVGYITDSDFFNYLTGKGFDPDEIVYLDKDAYINGEEESQETLSDIIYDKYANDNPKYIQLNEIQKKQEEIDRKRFNFLIGNRKASVEDPYKEEDIKSLNKDVKNITTTKIDNIMQEMVLQKQNTTQSKPIVNDTNIQQNQGKQKQKVVKTIKNTFPQSNSNIKRQIVSAQKQKQIVVFVDDPTNPLMNSIIRKYTVDPQKSNIYLPHVSATTEYILKFDNEILEPFPEAIKIMDELDQIYFKSEEEVESIDSIVRIYAKTRPMIVKGLEDYFASSNGKKWKITDRSETVHTVYKDTENQIDDIAKMFNEVKSILEKNVPGMQFGIIIEGNSKKADIFSGSFRKGEFAFTTSFDRGIGLKSKPRNYNTSISTNTTQQIQQNTPQGEPKVQDINIQQNQGKQNQEVVNTADNLPAQSNSNIKNQSKNTNPNASISTNGTQPTVTSVAQTSKRLSKQNKKLANTQKQIANKTKGKETIKQFSEFKSIGIYSQLIYFTKLYFAEDIMFLNDNGFNNSFFQKLTDHRKKDINSFLDAFIELSELKKVMNNIESKWSESKQKSQSLNSIMTGSKNIKTTEKLIDDNISYTNVIDFISKNKNALKTDAYRMFDYIKYGKIKTQDSVGNDIKKKLTYLIYEYNDILKTNDYNPSKLDNYDEENMNKNIKLFVEQLVNRKFDESGGKVLGQGKKQINQNQFYNQLEFMKKIYDVTSLFFNKPKWKNMDALLCFSNEKDAIIKEEIFNSYFKLGIEIQKKAEMNEQEQQQLYIKLFEYFIDKNDLNKVNLKDKKELFNVIDFYNETKKLNKQENRQKNILRDIYNREKTSYILLDNKKYFIKTDFEKVRITDIDKEEQIFDINKPIKIKEKEYKVGIKNGFISFIRQSDNEDNEEIIPKHDYGEITIGKKVYTIIDDKHLIRYLVDEKGGKNLYQLSDKDGAIIKQLKFSDQMQTKTLDKNYKTNFYKKQLDDFQEMYEQPKQKNFMMSFLYSYLQIKKNNDEQFNNAIENKEFINKIINKILGTNDRDYIQETELFINKFKENNKILFDGIEYTIFDQEESAIEILKERYGKNINKLFYDKIKLNPKETIIINSLELQNDLQIKVNMSVKNKFKDENILGNETKLKEHIEDLIDNINKAKDEKEKQDFIAELNKVFRKKSPKDTSTIDTSPLKNIVNKLQIINGDSNKLKKFTDLKDNQYLEQLFAFKDIEKSFYIKDKNGEVMHLYNIKIQLSKESSRNANNNNINLLVERIEKEFEVEHETAVYAADLILNGSITDRIFKQIIDKIKVDEKGNANEIEFEEKIVTRLEDIKQEIKDSVEEIKVSAEEIIEKDKEIFGEQASKTNFKIKKYQIFGAIQAGVQQTIGIGINQKIKQEQKQQSLYQTNTALKYNPSIDQELEEPNFGMTLFSDDYANNIITSVISGHGSDFIQDNIVVNLYNKRITRINNATN